MSVFATKTFPSRRHLALWIRVAALGFATGFLGYGSLQICAQTSQPRNSAPVPPTRPTLPNIDPFDMPPVYNGDPLRAKAEQRRLQYLNTERQKTMVADTNRLVKLAADLNAQINSQQGSQLTPDQVRQLAEIEKLAHNIREKMSASITSPPSFDSSPGFISPR